MATVRQQSDDAYALFPASASAAHHEPWFNDKEGQLAVDIRETADSIIVVSPIAGVVAEDLDVFLHNDMLTIRGVRHESEAVTDGKTLVKECHWGSFSRSIVLPEEVEADAISATLKNGVLTVRLPKLSRPRRRISIKDLGS